MTDRRKSSRQRNRSDRRYQRRKKICISGAIIDPESTHSAACIIRDANDNGCMLYSSSLQEFPEKILLHPQGLDRPIMANIAWQTQNLAGVKFDFEIDPEFFGDL